MIEEATENAAVVQAMLDNLIERGRDPKVCWLFVIDGAKALSKAIRKMFGRHTPIQRCQIHKARNIMERLPKSLQPGVRRVLRQAWELGDATKAEKLLRNLARRLLIVTRLGMPAELRRLLACTNIIENRGRGPPGSIKLP